MWPKTTHAVTSLARLASHYRLPSEAQSAGSIKCASTPSRTRFIDNRKKTIVRAYLTHPFTWPTSSCTSLFMLHPATLRRGRPSRIPSSLTQWSLSARRTLTPASSLHSLAGSLRSTRHSPTNLQADPREEDKRANSTGVHSDSSNAQTHATHGQTRTRIVTALPLTPAAQRSKALHRQSNRPCK